ncbi:MAG: ubiquinol-cytochrome c reductase iron-sulfur subunit [Thermoplasmata archaeon]
MSRREFIATAAKGTIVTGLGLAAVEAAYLFSYFGPTEGFMSDWKGVLPELGGDGYIVFKEEFVTEDDVLDVIDKTGAFIFLFPGVFHGRNEMLPGIISRDGEGNLYASSRKCTHEGCLVNFRDDIVISSRSFQKIWYCRCHDGVFDAQGAGEVLAGPPPSPLPQFDIAFVDDGALVKLAAR